MRRYLLAQSKAELLPLSCAIKSFAGDCQTSNSQRLWPGPLDDDHPYRRHDTGHLERSPALHLRRRHPAGRGQGQRAEHLWWAADGFDSEAVHDLRVALRRCRSMADGFRAIDPQKDWKRMRRQATALFDSFGALRDCHVITEWTQKLGQADDPITEQLLDHLRRQEAVLQQQAKSAIDAFDHKQWQSWTRQLGQRARRLPLGSHVFQVLALEKLIAARRLESSALKEALKPTPVQVGLA